MMKKILWCLLKAFMIWNLIVPTMAFLEINLEVIEDEETKDVIGRDFNSIFNRVVNTTAIYVDRFINRFRA